MNLIKNLDKRLLKTIGMVVGIILIVFIFLLVIIMIKNGRVSYTQVENKMITSAKKYYSAHEDELPKVNNGVVTISTDKLVEEKYLKPLTKLVKDKKAACSGQVSVTKHDDNLLYSATLNCGDKYETKKLKDVIVKEVVESGNGLYKVEDSYVFKGDNVNNYLSYAGKVWRILRINNDGTIRIIETTKRDTTEWDNRYNSEKQYNVGINDYTVSRAKEYLENLYEEISINDRAYIVKQNICIGKRSNTDTDNSGNIECSNILENQDLGLIQTNEFVLASLSDKCISPTNPECSNYNYISGLGTLWTVTADNKTTYKVFKISGSASAAEAASYAQIRMVVNINSQVNYVSGDGSEEKPYKFN